MKVSKNCESIKVEINNLGYLEKSVIYGSIDIKEGDYQRLGYMIIPMYHMTLSQLNLSDKAESCPTKVSRILDFAIKMID